MFKEKSECVFSVNQNAPRPSEHPPVRGENMLCSLLEKNVKINTVHYKYVALMGGNEDDLRLNFTARGRSNQLRLLLSSFFSSVEAFPATSECVSPHCWIIRRHPYNRRRDTQLISAKLYDGSAWVRRAPQFCRKKDGGALMYP